MALLLNQPVPDVQALFDLLADDRTVPDHHLPETGVDLEWERLLSAIHIRSEDYGTRSSSVLMIDAQGNASLHEKERAPERARSNSFISRLRYNRSIARYRCRELQKSQPCDSWPCRSGCHYQQSAQAPPGPRSRFESASRRAKSDNLRQH